MVVAQPMQAREGAGAAPGSVGLTIAPGEATVAAGGALELTALIYNMGSTSDHYLLDVAGVPPGWASIDAPFFSLAAGGLQRVAVTVRPPVAAAPTPAGAPLRLTVRASADGNLAMPGLVSVALTVRGPERATMELDRAEATGAEATFRATFYNPTAAPAPVALAVDDGGAGLRVRIAPDEALLIPPGERATLTVLVRRPRRAPAAPRAYDLTLRALDARGPDTGAPADLASSRRARFMYAPDWGALVPGADIDADSVIDPAPAAGANSPARSPSARPSRWPRPRPWPSSPCVGWARRRGRDTPRPPRPTRGPPPPPRRPSRRRRPRRPCCCACRRSRASRCATTGRGSPTAWRGARAARYRSRSTAARSSRPATTSCAGRGAHARTCSWPRTT